MILFDALRLNNRGVFEWSAASCPVGSDDESAQIQSEDAILSSFTASLNAVQLDIRQLSVAEEATGSTDANGVERTLSFRAHQIDPFHSVLGDAANQSERFVFHRAFEATFVEDMIDGATVADINMNDAVACSACVIFNMALVHHLKFLRDDRNLDGKQKAEQLYALALQALESCALPFQNSSTILQSSLQVIFLWIQLGALNNLGALKSHGQAQDPESHEESRSYFLEVMRVLNFVEREAKSSVDHSFHSLLNESEWNGMTRNCLAILFNMRRDQKIALAA
ncbi:MAG: hypothetical protein SGARI_001364 [Bacillariaceae sp.]